MQKKIKFQAQHILVIGISGSGKSTFAKKLSKKVNIELIHLDRYFWQANWNQVPMDKWLKITQKLIKKKKWIIDGNYGSTLPERAQKADLIIYFDYPRLRCLWRILKRIIKTKYFHIQREDMADGCPERFDWEFIKWVWSFPKKETPRITAVLKKVDNKNILIIKNDRQLKNFLGQI